MRTESPRGAVALSAVTGGLLGSLLAVVVTPVATGTPSQDVHAQRTPDAGNQLANRTGGVYKGSGDQAWTPYQRAKGKKKTLLGKIALAPKAKWYGVWIPTNQVAGKVRDHIQNAQAGDPEAL